MDRITSKDNPKYKMLSALMSSKKERAAQGQFVAEGLRLVLDAVKSGIVPVSVFSSESFAAKFPEKLEVICKGCKNCYVITDALAEKISDTKTPQGVFAVFNTLDKNLNIGEDWLVTALLTKNCNKIKLLPDTFCYYYNRSNTGSCTANMQREKILTQFKVYDILHEMFPENYRSEFSYTKCLITQELIDNSGQANAIQLLKSRGKRISFRDVCSFGLSNVSLRKKAILFMHWFRRKY